ncbi:MAG: lipoyl synthase [Acidobacteriota bacterium]|nr:MAG: lipoyl synthase [Acidobacteriota bacterium]
MRFTESPSTPVSSKPAWLKVRPPSGERYFELKRRLRGLRLATVCEEAHCPNASECWGGGTATFMLMGDTCTRGCRFCAVTSGRTAVLDPKEPDRVAEAVAEMELRYAVITSVNRDDLPDGGGAHFAETIRAVRARNPKTLVEVLIPDFQGDRRSLDLVLNAAPDVAGHNLETVERLTPRVRDRRASYRRSLAVLEHLKNSSSAEPASLTKSSLMLGLGETREEVLQAMRDLRAVGVDILTLGQYLRPTRRHLPVAEYVAPGQFEALRRAALAEGFLYAAAGPLVRSSYRAGEPLLPTAEPERTSHAET